MDVLQISLYFGFSVCLNTCSEAQIPENNGLKSATQSYQYHFFFHTKPLFNSERHKVCMSLTKLLLLIVTSMKSS